MTEARESGSVKYRIELVEKVVAILEAFSRDKPELTLKDIVELTGQTSSGAFRILTNLVRLGLLEHNDNGRYRVAPKLFRIGSLAVADIRHLALPWMSIVRERTQYTTNLIIRDGLAAVLVELLESSRPFRMAATVGSHDPLHCTAAGKCLLAFADAETSDALIRQIKLEKYTPNTITTKSALRAQLDEVRSRTYATDRGEYEFHARCIAVPVFDRTDGIAAVLSVTGPEGLLDEPDAEIAVASLHAAARGLSSDLGSIARSYPPERR